MKCLMSMEEGVRNEASPGQAPLLLHLERVPMRLRLERVPQDEGEGRHALRDRRSSILGGLLRAGILLSCFPGGPAGAQRVGAPSLGVDGLVLFREAGSVAVLAEATPYWQPVSTPSEELLGDFRYLPEYASARAQGQVFRLLEADRPEVVAAPDGRFVVVPWSFGPGCAEEGWGSPDWVRAGDTVAFLLAPTRVSSRERRDLRVFDVLGWHQPYPTGELIPFWRRDRRSDSVWLTAVEFYALLQVLPFEAVYRADPTEAAGPLLDWVGAEPGRAEAFPVAEILAEGRFLEGRFPEGRFPEGREIDAHQLLTEVGADPTWARMGRVAEEADPARVRREPPERGWW